jgi:hypothetical protein
MADKPDTGLRGALQLDQAANDLAKGLAPDAENPDADAEQLGLFSGSSVFGQLKDADGVRKASGPGRPRGSTNRTTRDLVKLITSKGKHPLLAMAEIVATPIDVIAATLGCKKIEAAEYHRKVMSDLAPYVAQRLPLAVQVQGANAGVLIINTGGPIGEQSAAGLDMRVIEHDEQNQALSGDDNATSHDDASHEEVK